MPVVPTIHERFPCPLGIKPFRLMVFREPNVEEFRIVLLRHGRVTWYLIVYNHVVIADSWKQRSIRKLTSNNVHVFGHNCFNYPPRLVVVTRGVTLGNTVLNKVAIDKNGIDFVLIGINCAHNVFDKFLWSIISVDA
jgi:hypothetical protein